MNIVGIILNHTDCGIPRHTEVTQHLTPQAKPHKVYVICLKCNHHHLLQVMAWKLH